MNLQLILNLSLLRFLIYSWHHSPKQEQAKASPTMTGNKRKSNNIATPAGLRTPPFGTTPSEDLKSAKRIKTEVVESLTKGRDTEIKQNRVE